MILFLKDSNKNKPWEQPNRYMTFRGWSGCAKICILHHRGVQLILAYSWARPAILVAGKGREGMFLFLLFLLFHSCSFFFPVPLFHLFYLYYHFSPFLWSDTKWFTRVDVSLNPNTINTTFNRFMPSGLFCLYSLDRSIVIRRGVWLFFIITTFYRDT